MIQETSLAAYASVDIGARQQEVLDAIRAVGRGCDQDFARHLDWSICRITPRRGELVRLGLVRADGFMTGHTGRTVKAWVAV